MSDDVQTIIACVHRHVEYHDDGDFIYWGWKCTDCGAEFVLLKPKHDQVVALLGEYEAARDNADAALQSAKAAERKVDKLASAILAARIASECAERDRRIAALSAEIADVMAALNGNPREQPTPLGDQVLSRISTEWAEGVKSGLEHLLGEFSRQAPLSTQEAESNLLGKLAAQPPAPGVVDAD